MPRLREDQAVIKVQIGGVNPLAPNDKPFTALAAAVPVTGWASLEGGDIESEDVKTRIGWSQGQNRQISLGGPPSRTNMTVEVHYSSEIDAIYQQLEGLAGNTSMSVSWTLVDPDGNLYPTTNTVSGILINVSRPNFNMNTAGAGMLTLVMSCHV